MSTVYVLTGSGPPDATTPSSVAVSSTNTYYTAVVGQGGAGALALHSVFTGTPTGTVTLWYTNKPNASEANDTDWVQDTTFTATNPAGAATKSFHTVGNLAAVRVRLKYVNASGSGTWAVWATVDTSP